MGDGVAARDIRRDQSFNKAFAAPKLDIVPVNQTVGLFDRLSVARTDQRLESNESPSSPTV
jgi:hypothetical protein